MVKAEENKEEVKESPEEKKKRERKLEKQIIVLFIILGLVLLSFLGVYQIFKPKPYFKYAGFNVYYARIQGIDENFYMIPITQGNGTGKIFLRNDPRQLKVPVEVKNESLIGIKELWTTVHPESSSDAILASNDLAIFTSVIGLDPKSGLTESDSDYPEITCENATKETRVFLIELGDETKVYEEGNCIIIHGKNYDELIKAADSLIMQWLIRIK